MNMSDISHSIERVGSRFMYAARTYPSSRSRRPKADLNRPAYIHICWHRGSSLNIQVCMRQAMRLSIRLRKK